MSYSQNNLFELKATKNTKEHASPRQVVAVVTLPKQEPVQHAQIVDEKMHESTSIPSSAQNMTNNNLNNSAHPDQSSAQLIAAPAIERTGIVEEAGPPIGYARKFLSANMFNLKA